MKSILLILASVLLPAALSAQPTITTEPASQHVPPGGAATFSVLASGVGPFTYQWVWNGTNLPASIITTVAGGGLGDGGAAVEAMIGPQAVVVDGAGNLFIADYGHNCIRKVDTNGIISTVAGKTTSGYSGDGGPALNATFSAPNGLAVDAAGNLFIADTNNKRVRKVDTKGVIRTVAGNSDYLDYGDGGAATEAGVPYPTAVALDAAGTNLFIVENYNHRVRKMGLDGIIRALAGTGVSGYSGDGGAATNAQLYNPSGVAADAAGNVFIADMNNKRIRKVDTKGIITTVAGSGAYAFSGDGGAATNAGLSVSGVAVDVIGNLLITDWLNYLVRKVDTNGIITTIAGNGSSLGPSGDGGAATNAAISVGTGVTVDWAGNLFFAGNARIRKVGTNGIITTVAGNGSATYAGNGCPATNAQLYYPYGAAVDAAGDLFITDQSNVRIRKVDTNGIITTVAGIGLTGYAGDGGPALNAKFNEPYGVAVDAAGNVFIADWRNYRVRRVGADGMITTVAGGGLNTIPYDGSAATNADLEGPYGVAVDAAGNLSFTDYNVAYKVDRNNILTKVAGTGYSGYSGDGGPATSARTGPYDVAVDAVGNLFLADTSNNRIRKVDTNGIITTVAGNGTTGYGGDGGPATNAVLCSCTAGVAVDAAGNVFIADQMNNRIRKVDPNGIITTVAGNGINGYAGDGGPATRAELSEPYGVAVDAADNLFIVDTMNHRIRKVSPFASLPTLTVNNVTTNNAGNYQVIVSSAGGSVTSSVATLTVAAVPPVIVSATLNGNGSVTLSLAGASGATSRLWATASLARPIVWQPISTNMAGGAWQFTETNTVPYPQRFYRLSTP